MTRFHLAMLEVAMEEMRDKGRCLLCGRRPSWVAVWQSRPLDKRVVYALCQRCRCKRHVIREVERTILERRGEAVEPRRAPQARANRSRFLSPVLTGQKLDPRTSRAPVLNGRKNGVRQVRRCQAPREGKLFPASTEPSTEDRSSLGCSPR